MDAKFLLAVVLIAGGAAGLLLPAGGAISPPAEPRFLDTSPTPASQAAATPDLWAENIVLTRELDGHFYADVEVDGQPLHMLVDTGASVVALTGADAEALGLLWEESEVVPVAQGASGPVSGVAVTIPEMSLGGHSARNVQALIIPQGLAVSLLGQSFLSTLGQVRMSGGQMVLGNGDS